MAILQNVRDKSKHFTIENQKKHYFFEIQATKKAQQTLGNFITI
ncbi:hypothetical protein [Streptococcus suis]